MRPGAWEADGTAMYSIVILTHNKAPYTRRCLESILQSGVAGVECVCVDNGSRDETADLLHEMEGRFRDAGGRLRPIFNGRNVGCCTGRNIGIDAAEGDYIVFLDNDTIVPDRQWLAKMSGVLREHEKARIVGPKLCYPFAPHLIQCAGVGISRTGRVQFRGRGEPQDTPRYAAVEEVQTVISACMMFDADLPREIGGLDEAFNPIEFEDFDFCYRARERGHRVIYTPDPVVYHWESVTSDGTKSLPNTYLIIKHGLLFKRRWRHMFAKEDGPADEETVWQEIEVPSLDGRRTR